MSSSTAAAAPAVAAPAAAAAASSHDLYGHTHFSNRSNTHSDLRAAKHKNQASGALTKAELASLEATDPKKFANALIDFANDARSEARQAFVHEWLSRLGNRMRAFTPKTLSCVLGAFGVLETHDARFLRKWFKQVIQRHQLLSFSPLDIAHSLYAIAQMRVEPPAEFWPAFDAHFGSTAALAQFLLPATVTTFCAWVQLNRRTGFVFECLRNRILSEAARLDLQQITQVAQAYACMKAALPLELQQSARGTIAEIHAAEPLADAAPIVPVLSISAPPPASPAVSLVDALCAKLREGRYTFCDHSSERLGERGISKDTIYALFDAHFVMQPMPTTPDRWKLQAHRISKLVVIVEWSKHALNNGQNPIIITEWEK